MSFVLRQTTQLELSQEDEAASGGLGIASALTANRSGSYQSTTSPSIARSLSTSPDELLDSPPPPPPSDHRRSSITTGTKQQQHFICSSTTNRGATLAASNSTTARSIIRIQVWLSGSILLCLKKKKTRKEWHADCVLFRGGWKPGRRSVDPADMVGESAGSMMLDDCWITCYLLGFSSFFASDVVSCSSHNKFVIGIMPRHVNVYSRKIKTDRVLKH